MQIVEFGSGTLRFLDRVPAQPPQGGFLWIYLEREQLEAELPVLQEAARALGGSSLLDLHVKDLANRSHPSSYDYTSVYDLVIFRRLAVEAEVQAELGDALPPADAPLAAFARVRTRAIGFVVFDRLLISVHPAGCPAARTFIQRYLGEALQAESVAAAAARSRLPNSAPDLMLRILNMVVDSYLDLRRELSAQLDAWQRTLLGPRSRGADWGALMTARTALHMLADLCEEQNDAMQEWLDGQQEQPPAWMGQDERDLLLARGRDVAEHVDRVLHHVQRMEEGAESAVQIHFSAQGNRTNDIMRTLTSITAIFLPLNLIAAVFGMNFEFLPLIHWQEGFWWTLAAMGCIAIALGVVFWRKRYLARTGR